MAGTWCAWTVVSPRPAPRLTLQEASDALDATDFAFLFYADPRATASSPRPPIPAALPTAGSAR